MACNVGPEGCGADGQGRNGSGQTSMDFQRQGTLAGDLSLPSDSATPHSRTTSTPSSIGRLQRIGAAQLWQVLPLSL